MNDEEWRQTDTARAIAAFMGSTLSVVINVFGGEVGGLLTRLATLSQKNKIEKQIEDNGLPLFLKDFIDPNRDDALRGGMYLMAALSALEACVEDITKAAIREDPSLTKRKQFARLRNLEAAGYFAEADEKIESLYVAIEESVGLKAGVNRYEDTLDFVGLKGVVPDLISQHIYAAQLVRNVWAHSAGRADAKFVEKGQHLRWEVGDLVKLTLEEIRDYLVAILLYGMIITNRHRVACGLEPAGVNAEPRENESELAAAYRALYTTD